MTNGRKKDFILGLMLGGLFNIVTGITVGFYFHYSNNILDMGVAYPFWIGIVGIIVLLLFLYVIYHIMER